ncbi:MAG: GntR family transcriptional regulator [Ottowia sp.]|uniref:GntR family transcriptional regulator n=1 Tax=Ottowia sp. TaxID=1898956 RepID=UPI0039E45A05
MISKPIEEHFVDRIQATIKSAYKEKPVADASFVVERAPSLGAQVTQYLLEAIEAGRIRPGDRLVETDLAVKLGISRAPLREALRHLSSSGLVEHRPGRGTYIANASDDSVEQMGLFRGMLEGDAATLLASRRPTDILRELADLIRHMETPDVIGDPLRFVDFHWIFHRTICMGADNEYLLTSWDQVSRQIKMYLNTRLHVLDHGRVVRNNRAVLQTLASADPATAGALVRSLIIRQTFHVLGRALPVELSCLVTLTVDNEGQVVSISPS